MFSRRLAHASLAALLLATPLTVTLTAAATPSVAFAAPAATVEDADDLIPYVEEVRAALILLGAPTIDELDVLDSAPLAGSFDEGARYVAVPTSDTGQLTMTAGAWIVEDGTDERQEFARALRELRSFAQAGGGSIEEAAVEAANMFGANEATEVAIARGSAGRPTSLLVGRLARFGKAIAFTSSEIELRASEVRPEDSNLAATISVIVAKLVADKAQ